MIRKQRPQDPRALAVTAAAVAFAIGTATLWFVFASLGNTPRFVGLSAIVALVWVSGWLAVTRWTSGVDVEKSSSFPAVRLALLVSVIVCALFALGTLVILQIDGLADGVRSAVVGAESSSLMVSFTVALVTGASEELFFRGALPRLHRSPMHGHLWSTLAYTISTVATANVALITAAPILGLACSWVYLKTGRIITPIIVHASWTVAMVGLLPNLL